MPKIRIATLDDWLKLSKTISDEKIDEIEEELESLEIEKENRTETPLFIKEAFKENLGEIIRLPK
jgi:hypothetical protein